MGAADQHPHYTINLKGWTLRDKASHVYTFTSDYYLGAGTRV